MRARAVRRREQFLLSGISIAYGMSEPKGLHNFLESAIPMPLEPRGAQSLEAEDLWWNGPAQPEGVNGASP